MIIAFVKMRLLLEISKNILEQDHNQNERGNNKYHPEHHSDPTTFFQSRNKDIIVPFVEMILTQRGSLPVDRGLLPELDMLFS